MRKKFVLGVLLAATALYGSSVYALNPSIGLSAKGLFLQPIGEIREGRADMSGVFMMGPHLHWRVSDDFTLAFGGYFCAQPLDLVFNCGWKGILSIQTVQDFFGCSMGKRNPSKEEVKQFVKERIQTFFLSQLETGGLTRGEVERCIEAGFARIIGEEVSTGGLNPAPVSSSHTTICVYPMRVGLGGDHEAMASESLQADLNGGFNYGALRSKLAGAITGNSSRAFVEWVAKARDVDLPQFFENNAAYYQLVVDAGITTEEVKGASRREVVEIIRAQCKTIYESSDGGSSVIPDPSSCQGVNYHGIATRIQHGMNKKCFVEFAAKSSSDDLRQFCESEAGYHQCLASVGLHPSEVNGADKSCILDMIARQWDATREQWIRDGALNVPPASDTAKAHAAGSAFRIDKILDRLLADALIRFNVSLRQHIPIVIGAEYNLYSSGIFSLGVFGSVGFGIWTAKAAARAKRIKTELLFESEGSSYSVVGFGGLKFGFKLGSATIALSGGYGYFGKPDIKWNTVSGPLLSSMEYPAVHGLAGSAEIGFQF